MQRRATAHLDAPPEVAASLARDALHLDDEGRGPLPGNHHAEMTVSVQVGESGGTVLDLVAVNDTHVPFFDWWFQPVFRWEMRRGMAHALASVQAVGRGEPALPPLRTSAFAPPAAFDDHQGALLATVALAGLIVSFAGALFGQNADQVATTFDISNGGLGEALAITRFGALLALFAAALADRIGRRRILLFAIAGVCIANAISAVAPTFAAFTGAQLLVRAGVQTALVVGGIAVVEEAPEDARAFSVAMFGLAAGAGFALSVVLLPLADLGDEAWRIAFGVSSLAILALPVLARHLRETTRYTRLAARSSERGRFREVFDPAYGRRFLLLAAVGFLANVFSAPSAQLTNRFLGDERGFSSSGIALFRGVTNGVPGLIGILLASRLTETHGRRPVARVGLFVGTLLTMVFFLGQGAVLWVTSALALLAAASSTVAVGTMDAELFPTEVRGTSGALLLVCSVLGSAVGLLGAGILADSLGDLGLAIALCGIAPLVAAVFLLPHLPEPSGRALDDVSPPEI